jgi:hypothetical protein
VHGALDPEHRSRRHSRAEFRELAGLAADQPVQTEQITLQAEILVIEAPP